MDALPSHDDVEALIRAGRLAEAAEVVDLLQGAARSALTQQPGDHGALARIADADTQAAFIARRSDRLDDALRHANSALEAADRGNDMRQAALARCERAHVLADLGFPEEALDDAYSALANTRGGEALEARALDALAAVQWTMARFDDARSSYRRMLEIGEARSDAGLQALALAGLSGIDHLQGSQCEAEGRADDALALWRRAADQAARAAEFAAAAGDTHRLYTARHNRAVALMALNESDTARAELTELLAQPYGPHDASRRALALKNLGNIDVTEGRYAAAIERFNEALETFDRLGQLPYASACCESLVGAHEANGDLAAALRCHRRYHELYVRVASQAAQMRASAMAVKYGTELAQATAQQERHRAEQLERAHDRLSVEAARLAKESAEDALTGLANRRRFDAVLDAALADRRGTQFSLALLDIDHFKKVNDRFSHLVGDRVLQRVAALLQQNMRRGDLAARYGGEEFALVFTSADTAAARTACERIRQAIESAPWGDIAPGLAVTVSIGLAHGAELGVEREARVILGLADSRLYAAKGGGRNRVVGEVVCP